MAAAKKFNLTELLNQRSKEMVEQKKQKETEEKKDVEIDRAITTVDIYDLIPSKDNFYQVEDVQDLKQSIELLGILQPLLVTKEKEGKWRILAGHRRRLAVMQLVEEGKKQFQQVPIIVKSTKNTILDRLSLIMANRFREKTDWEKMTESLETERLVLELKEQMDIPGRTRDLLAEMLETSPAQLGRYKAIYNNLVPELMAEFKAGAIGVSVIYEASGLDKEYQKQAAELFRESEVLTLTDVKRLRSQQEEVKQISGQMMWDGISEQLDTIKNEEKIEQSICKTCIHKGECVTKTTDACIGYEKVEGEYIESQPESIISLCYSCIKYEICHDKEATVTNCNAYKNREEEYKTDEQKYSEKQAKIDAETKKKLREQQQEEVMKRVAEQKQREEIRISSDKYEEIVSGKLTFLLLKKDGYKEGERIELREYKNGKETGKKIDIEVQYIWQDWTGLDENYCIVGFGITEKGAEDGKG